MNTEIFEVRNCAEFVDWVERNLVFIRVIPGWDIDAERCYPDGLFVVFLHSYRQGSR